MKTIKVVASATTIVTGVLGAYVGYASPTPAGSQLLLSALGIVLVLDSLVCLYGVNVAFAGAAVVSAVLVFTCLIGWGGAYTGLKLVTLLIAVLNIVLSTMAFRSSTGLPEQANPMNLPVFG